MSFSGWMNKQILYIHAMEYYIANKKEQKTDIPQT
jgi:hypothetical protein